MRDENEEAEKQQGVLTAFQSVSDIGDAKVEGNCIEQTFF